eukprot:2237305-Pleurochrysis_carterae.AAC.2
MYPDALRLPQASAPVLCPGHEGAHVEREQLALAQALRYVAGRDALRQALCDGGLPHTGLAQQDRVVLGAARQD